MERKHETSFLKQFGAAGAAALAVTKAEGLGMGAQAPAAPPAPTPTDQKQIATRDARMAWWHEAKFGMFIHWGLYSISASTSGSRSTRACRYLNTRFSQAPPSQTQRGTRWARLARRAGQKYMVMTTKHHEAFATGTPS